MARKWHSSTDWLKVPEFSWPERRVTTLSKSECVLFFFFFFFVRWSVRPQLTKCNNCCVVYCGRCFILNCDVVVELLSSKLQDPSDTVKMVMVMSPMSFIDVYSCCNAVRWIPQRALCAVACLMTSDLLSMEQMFGATQRRLHQLSEGPPGPAANKATKVGVRTDKVTHIKDKTVQNEVTFVCFSSPARSCDNLRLLLVALHTLPSQIQWTAINQQLISHSVTHLRTLTVCYQHTQPMTPTSNFISLTPHLQASPTQRFTRLPRPVRTCLWCAQQRRWCMIARRRNLSPFNKSQRKMRCSRSGLLR